MPGEKCAKCGKTAYPLESLVAANQIWHKACFKCQADGCDISLNIKTASQVQNMVYCSKHVPKDKPLCITVDQSMSLSNAKKSQKESSTVNKVSNEQRGELVGQKSSEGVDSMGLGRAMETQKLGSSVNKVSNEQRGELVGQKSSEGVDSMGLGRAIETQKLGSSVNKVSNEQRGELAGQRNAQVPDMATQNALKAPKVGVVNEQVRTEHARALAKGTGEPQSEDFLELG